MTTGRTRCPFCGGALAPDQERCTYCGNNVDLAGGLGGQVPSQNEGAPLPAAAAGPPRLWLSTAVAIFLFAAGVAAWYLRVQDSVDSPPHERAARGTPLSPVGAPAEGPHLPSPPARVTLKVRSIPSGAEAFLGGEPLGRTPLDVDLAPNAAHRKLTLQAEGYLPSAAVIALDESSEVLLTLERAAAAPDHERAVPEAQQEPPRSLSRTTISQVLRASRPAVQRCYEQGLLENPRLSGRVDVTMTIDPTGRMSESGVTSSSLDEAVVEACIETVLGRLRFPPFDGDPVTIRYPFVFRSSGD